MTAITQTPRPNRAPLMALALLAVAVLATLAIPEVGRVMETTHATDRHGVDARLTRDCLERNGPLGILPDRDDDSIRWLPCQLDDGRLCVQIVQKWPSVVQQVEWRERTAFCLGSNLDRAWRYIAKRARGV